MQVCVHDFIHHVDIPEVCQAHRGREEVQQGHNVGVAPHVAQDLTVAVGWGRAGRGGAALMAGRGAKAPPQLTTDPSCALPTACPQRRQPLAVGISRCAVACPLALPGAHLNLTQGAAGIQRVVEDVSDALDGHLGVAAGVHSGAHNTVGCSMEGWEGGGEREGREGGQLTAVPGWRWLREVQQLCWVVMLV